MATQREQAVPKKAMHPAGWTTRGTPGRSRTRRREVDEDGRTQSGRQSNKRKRAETKKEFEETVEVVELAEVGVNEEEVEWRQFEEEGGLDPEHVRQAREEEMNYMVKTLGMFEFGSWQEGTSKAGKAPTTTELIDRVK